jgi:hypothetical protein
MSVLSSPTKHLVLCFVSKGVCCWPTWVEQLYHLLQELVKLYFIQIKVFLNIALHAYKFNHWFSALVAH